MQAIETRYMPASNTLPARIVARTYKRRSVFSYWELPGETMETKSRAAALAHAIRLGWDGDWIAGSFGEATLWVCTESPHRFTAPELSPVRGLRPAREALSAARAIVLRDLEARRAARGEWRRTTLAPSA